MNQLEYVLNNIPNWEQVLTASPFNLKVSRDGQYLMLKYDQLNSDMSSPIVQSARGIIFKEVEGVPPAVFRKQW